MKRGLLFVALSGLMLIGTWAWYGNAASEKNYYQPRTVEADYSANDAFEYVNSRRRNQVTGKIELADVQNAQAAFNQLPRNKNANLGLQWEEFGPDNLGGRTRSLIFDKDNPSIMFMGSVSGGIYKSVNAGRSWNEVNDQMSNLSIVSLEQGLDGTIYAGTGENLYYASSGGGSRGMLGQGIFKSTDDGATFTQMSSTLPAGNGSETWTSVGKIEVDPNDAQLIYAATNGGLQVSNDGGTTWNGPLPGAGLCRDMVITSTGTVIAKQLDRTYRVTDQGQTVVEISSAIAGLGDLPRTSRRMRFAVAPQDENYIYAIEVDGSDQFEAAHKSTDGGDSWTVIGTRNQLLNPHRNQGRFNNSIAVDPKDKDRILVGGVEVWEYSSSTGWFQIATQSRFSTLFYLHADNHNIVFHPTNLSTIYITNDGGLFKSTDNGFTFSMENKGYATIQYYGIDDFLDGAVLGGTQDNSNIKVDPNGPLPKAGTIFSSGDGGVASVSHLDPNVFIIASQYGNLVRTDDNGENFSGFYSLRVRGNRTPGGRPSATNPIFADFVTPFDLHENLRDLNSTDSVEIVADTIATSIGFGNSGNVYTGQFVKPQQSTQFVPESFVITAGNQQLVSDASGNLTGDGTGTFDSNAGTFSVTFNNNTTFEIFITAATRYAPGAIVQIESATGGLIVTDTIKNGLAPNESIKIQDPVQSIFAVGITAYNNTGQSTNKYGGVWITREAVSNVGGIPEWWHIGELANNEIPSKMEFSGDGDMLLVATNAGRVYRFTNLNQARSRATADIDDDYSTNPITPNTSVVQSSVIFSSSQAITALAIDPDDNDRIFIGLGNYGNSTYAYYTDRGTSPGLSTALFANVTSNLPPFPVYDAIFNYNDPSDGQVILGTEYGVLATEDIDANTVTWNSENNGLANVPVFDLEQTRTIRYDLKNNSDFEGTIFAGTHGRGIFKTNSTVDYVGIQERDQAIENISNAVLGLYPNPASAEVNIELNLVNRADVKISVRDFTGKQLKVLSLKAVPAGTEKVRLPVSDLKTGNYIVTLTAEGKTRSGKLVVVK
jgi:hypothetical protein